MLRWRLISAAIIVSALLLVLWGDFWLGDEKQLGRPGLLLLPIGLVVAALATGELLSMYRSRGHRPVAWTTYLGTVLVIAGACTPLLWNPYPEVCSVGRLGWPLLALAAGVGLAFIGEMRRYEKPGGAILNVALAVFPMAYVGLLLGFVAALRMFHSNAWGMMALLSMVIIVKVSDSGAYFVGRAIGKHKLAPNLSPGKTIEGALGAFLFGGLASWLVFEFLAPAITGEQVSSLWWAVLIYAAAVTAAGMIGDLAESLIKRDMDVKDSSTWLPGLGGVLDILDSVLAAAPAAFACWAAGLIGPG